MRGFKSKGLVRENYAWRHYYWYLTNEGIEHLREKLHLPATIIPATLKSNAKYAKQAAAFERTERPRGDDKEVAPAEFNPEFVCLSKFYALYFITFFIRKELVEEEALLKKPQLMLQLAEEEATDNKLSIVHLSKQS